MTMLPAANIPGEIDGAEPPALICAACGTADDLIIEGIGGTIPAVAGFVSIEYSCLECGSFYGHDASVQQVAKLLDAGVTSLGVLHFAYQFFHCGEPMEDIAEGLSGSGGPNGSQGGLAAEMSTGIRLLQCHCGFQLEVPR